MVASAVVPHAWRNFVRGLQGRNGFRARERGHCRHLDPGQDRCAGAGCGRVFRPRLRQWLFQAGGGQSPLRFHAARGRHRAGRRHHHPDQRNTVFHDDHHGPSRQGDEPSGVFTASGVAGTARHGCVGHRPVGGDERGGAACAAGPASGLPAPGFGRYRPALYGAVGHTRQRRAGRRGLAHPAADLLGRTGV